MIAESILWTMWGALLIHAPSEGGIPYPNALLISWDPAESILWTMWGALLIHAPSEGGIPYPNALLISWDPVDWRKK